jgi:quercetin dioxygenase-like cupin family protein
VVGKTISLSRILLRETPHHFVKKDWGSEEWIVNTPEYCGKRMTLNKGWQCSMHYHRIKHETFYVLTGKIKLELGEYIRILLPGDSIEIPVGMPHRFGGLEDSVFFEFSTHHEDSDSYRTELGRYNPDLIEVPE